MLHVTFLLSLFFPNIFGPSLLPSGGQTEKLSYPDHGWHGLFSNFSINKKIDDSSYIGTPIRGSP